MGYFVELGRLRTTDRVLDVGCGPGRMAVPLTRYLATMGRYEGFDVTPRAVEWCRGAISSRYPSFRFQVLDVQNAFYNPGGAERGSALRWPYDDASFDFAIATSVFTHLRPDDAAAYLDEIGRVLRPGGRLVATYFLLDEESRALIEAGSSRYRFAHGEDPAWSDDPGVFEAAVAYDAAFVKDRHDASGLPIVSRHRGAWSGGDESLTWQDLVVARRG
jgi:SAM-dependent methyltransferase